MVRMFFPLFYVAVAVFFMACSKSGDSSRQLSRTAANSLAGKGAGEQRKMDSGGSICNCQPGQNSCVANCYFSDCCVCWNSTLETGACGCYFGIAKCNTGPIGKDSRLATEQQVNFFPERFTVFLNYLQESGLQILPLQQAFSTLLLSQRPAVQPAPDNPIKLPALAYTLFFDRYRQFMEGLPEPDQQRVVDYIQSRNARH